VIAYVNPNAIIAVDVSTTVVDSFDVSFYDHSADPGDIRQNISI